MNFIARESQSSFTVGPSFLMAWLGLGLGLGLGVGVELGLANPNPNADLEDGSEDGSALRSVAWSGLGLGLGVGLGLGLGLEVQRRRLGSAAPLAVPPRPPSKHRRRLCPPAVRDRRGERPAARLVRG